MDTSGVEQYFQIGIVHFKSILRENFVFSIDTMYENITTNTYTIWA